VCVCVAHVAIKLDPTVVEVRDVYRRFSDPQLEPLIQYIEFSHY